VGVELVHLGRAVGDRGEAQLPELRERVWRANLGLVQAGLVTLSFGNASGLWGILRVDRSAP